jgi:2,3-bisphosphoglycerate-independent phosphoglycerate mutase
MVAMTMTDWKLHPHATLQRARGPLAVIVLDGVGIGCGDAFDAVAQAPMPTLQRLMRVPGRFAALRAHGSAVGLPSDDDMGNSEVGHNALGAGRVVRQGAALVDDAIASGALAKGSGFAHLRQRFANGTFHVVALLSDGGVHSRLDQILAVLTAAADAGAWRMRIHVLLDGRDVPDQSADRYIAELEAHLTTLWSRGIDARIASGGGRMVVTMDRYNSDWSIVERGYQAHVLGEAPHRYPSAAAAIIGLRALHPGISDQQLPPFVVVDERGPIGVMADGDAVLLANFRGDRAIQFCRALEERTFSEFPRPTRPNVSFAGMMEYDGDLHIPKHFLVSPPVIERTSGEYLAHNGIRTFSCSETQKFGHVTYFWNGNRSGRFDEQLETYVEIPSHAPPFETRPEMQAPAIAQAAIAAIRSGQYDVIRLNFANGDMVGHTGELAATMASCRAADAALAEVIAAVEQAGGRYLVVADHGNADDMALRDKAGAPLRDDQGLVLARTSHTLALVPCCVGGALPDGVVMRADAASGLANVAATCLNLLGFEAPAEWSPTLLG